MRFPALIFKNLLRRKTRRAFAILGISIGIATIIALGAVTERLKFSMDQILKTGKVIVDDTDLLKVKNLDEFRAKKIGFIFQLHNLLLVLTTRENVEIPMFELGKILE